MSVHPFHSFVIVRYLLVSTSVSVHFYNMF